MSPTRPLFWTSSQQHGLVSPTGGGFTQEDFAWFSFFTGQTLIRTRMDVCFHTFIANLDTNQAYDPSWWSLVSAWVGLYWVDGDGSEVPPALNDNGPGIDWVMWNALSPRVEIAPSSLGHWDSAVSWRVNGDVTLDSRGKRGPATGAIPQLFMSWAFTDPLQVLNHFDSHYVSSTEANIAVRALVEDTP